MAMVAYRHIDDRLPLSKARSAGVDFHPIGDRMTVRYQLVDGNCLAVILCEASGFEATQMSGWLKSLL